MDRQVVLILPVIVLKAAQAPSNEAREKGFNEMTDWPDIWLECDAHVPPRQQRSRQISAETRSPTPPPPPQNRIVES
jgi:hypothetical protein